MARASFIRSRIAASVDDLPDPVGPVTSTMPWRSGTMASSVVGSPKSFNVGIVTGMTRMTTANEARWRKMFTRKRARPASE